MSDTHIKINAVTPKVQYTGNGSTVEFPYEFAIFDETDMDVYLDDELQEYGYTVSGEGETEGGNVTFDTAPEDGVKITLIRNIPIERVTDFQEGGAFRPKNLNDEFDRQTAFLQQVEEANSRCVKVSPTSDISPDVVVAQVERVYDSIDNIDAVADDLTNVDKVAAIDSDVSTVAGVASDVSTVAGMGTGIAAIIANETNINTVASNVSDIAPVGQNISDVVAVSNGLANIAEVKDNATNVNTVAANISDVQAVAAGAEYLAPIGQNLTDISTVASDLTGSDTVGTVASNISDVAAVGSNISNVNAVNANKTNIDAVANNMTTIQNLSAASANLEAVGNNLSDISTVAADLNGDDNIGTVVANMSDINLVGSNITNVVNAGSNSTNITAVAANKTNIDTVATNLSDISAVATNITNVNAVANNGTNINAVAGNSTNINAVNSNKTNIDTVAGNATNINAVASNSSNINSVATNISDVGDVSDNISAVNNVSSHMSDISNVNSHMAEIQSAITSSENAEKWAEGTDAQVAPLGGTHSSKGWATISQGYVTSCQTYAASAEDSSLAAYNYKQDAATSASNASSYAAQALSNSQKLLKSINPANCWYRTYTDLDTEKRYQLLTLASDNTVTIADTVYTTTDDIIDIGVYEANISNGYCIGNTIYYKVYGDVSRTVTNVEKIIGTSNNTTQYLTNDGKVYYCGTYGGSAYNGTYSSGWTLAYYVDVGSNQHTYGFGIRDGKLYHIINTGSGILSSAYFTATLLDDTGTWTYVTGTNKTGSSYIGLGIKDGKLYKIENLTVSLLDDNIAWTEDMLYYYPANSTYFFTAINGRLYSISSSGVTQSSSTLFVAKRNGKYIITNDGKLYYAYTDGSAVYTEQIGTDTGWTDLSNNSNGTKCLAIRNGDLYVIASTTATQKTSGKSYTCVRGNTVSGLSYTNTYVVWEQTPITKYEYAYTTPTSAVGDYLYGTTALGNPRAIVSISSSSVSDATYIYTRDSSKDTYFTDKPDTYVSRALTTDDIIDALT